ncbi:MULTISPECIES: AzlC family ABC transporter permease [Rhizobium/Agrobacterium group]|uniref:AzlC family ABC transporter permease n=2 Tax=Neorhizobium TaxID=1525371 RepID=A0ABV0M3U7_9HYPH|nr:MULTISPECIES: AzlC family ABC transporter permease [Rhizobium/Agrobacterium group]KGE00778.1 branched-chain amino acid ABC transporter permease [Rhizobium sp. YS-1r]MCC2610389.1 AzlC family ABC transporter permease [Neorhizobium petrolearium]WGI70536.1 AzlC family ABC transporter permease [Neorhizobium petrolearium]
MNRSEFYEGLKGGIIIAISSAPFAVLFGAVAADNGLSVMEAGLMSATVYAGASQLVGIELFGQHVAPWLVVLSVFAVNFRHILYSAALARFVSHFNPVQKFFTFFLLTDPQFAESVRRGESGIGISFPWYLGFGAAIYFPWLFFSMVGAFFGRMMGDPRTLAIDVLLPIYFLGLVIGFRRRPGFYPVVVASALGSMLGYHFVGSPWHVSIGAAVGVVVAALLPLPKERMPMTAASETET